MKGSSRDDGQLEGKGSTRGDVSVTCIDLSITLVATYLGRYAYIQCCWVRMEMRLARANTASMIVRDVGVMTG